MIADFKRIKYPKCKFGDKSTIGNLTIFISIDANVRRRCDAYPSANP